MCRRGPSLERYQFRSNFHPTIRRRPPHRYHWTLLRLRPHWRVPDPWAPPFQFEPARFGEGPPAPTVLPVALGPVVPAVPTPLAPAAPAPPPAALLAPLLPALAPPLLPPAPAAPAPPPP